jgi:hypothetical protein
MNRLKEIPRIRTGRESDGRLTQIAAIATIIGTVILVLQVLAKENQSTSPVSPLPPLSTVTEPKTPSQPAATLAAIPASPSSTVQASVCPRVASIDRRLKDEQASIEGRWSSEEVLVLICRTNTDQLIYYGLNKSPTRSDILLDAERSGEGFVAWNGKNRYSLAGDMLSVKGPKSSRRLKLNHEP